MDDEPTGSLWFKFKEQTGMGDIVVGVCCRPPDQEEEVFEAFYKQLETTSGLQALALMGDLNHSNTCWRSNTATQNNSRASWRASVTTS